MNAPNPPLESAAAEMPPIGTRTRCRRCGRVVWFRKIAVTGSMSTPPSAPVYGWAARKGTKPRPLSCPDSRRHEVDGYASEYYGPAHTGWDQ